MLVETCRLITRQATSEDGGFIAEVLTNEQVQRFTGGVKDTLENTLKLIHRNPLLLADFYIVEIKNGEKIGFINFVPNTHFSEKELLISLLPKYCSKGYGFELLTEITSQWLTKNKDMNVTVKPENIASINLLKKVGFRLVEEYEEAPGARQHVYKLSR